MKTTICTTLLLLSLWALPSTAAWADEEVIRVVQMFNADRIDPEPTAAGIIDPANPSQPATEWSLFIIIPLGFVGLYWMRHHITKL